MCCVRQPNTYLKNTLVSSLTTIFHQYYERGNSAVSVIRDFFDDLPPKNVDLPSKNVDLPSKNVDLPVFCITNKSISNVSFRILLSFSLSLELHFIAK